jgi:hypothetical protein
MLTHQRRQTAADQAKTTKTPRRVLSFPIELDHAIARSPDHDCRLPSTESSDSTPIATPASEMSRVLNYRLKRV